MRTCEIDNCNRKHHAKGLCAPHYNGIVPLNTTPCSVPDCNNIIGKSGALGYCCKHRTRFKRHGNPLLATRERTRKAFISELESCPNPWEFEFTSRASLGKFAKILFGSVCQKCGWDEGHAEAHHIIKRSSGGKNTLSNMQILCPNCHSLEHKTPPIARFSKETIERIKELFKQASPFGEGNK